MNNQLRRAQQRKILVVDDEASFTRLLKLNLEATERYVVRVENDHAPLVTALRPRLPGRGMKPTIRVSGHHGLRYGPWQGGTDLRATERFSLAITKTGVDLKRANL